MSKLRDALRGDPDSVYECHATLPSGCKMVATVGPIINGKLCAQIIFEPDSPTPQDIDDAKLVMDMEMGMTADKVLIARNQDEKRRVLADRRRFLGGGVG